MNHITTTTTEHQIPDLGQVQTIAAGLIKHLNGTKPSPFSKTKVQHHNIDRYAIKYQLS